MGGGRFMGFQGNLWGWGLQWGQTGAGGESMGLGATGREATPPVTSRGAAETRIVYWLIHSGGGVRSSQSEAALIPLPPPAANHDEGAGIERSACPHSLSPSNSAVTSARRDKATPPRTDWLRPPPELSTLIGEALSQ